jgi:rubrerythrin
MKPNATEQWTDSMMVDIWICSECEGETWMKMNENPTRCQKCGAVFKELK